MTHFKRIVTAPFIAVLFISCFFSFRPEVLAQRRDDRFSQKEKLWAAKWITEKLSLLMEDGLIKKIEVSEDDHSYKVFVSSSWRHLSTEEKRSLLGNLSRAREITHHSPYLVVSDSNSGEVVAQVNEWGILIFGE